ncbi:MAG: flavodoxin family protein [Agathobaculum sp.]|uniref:flavodoxin family protein n=1 Tax=Agathobaculum sp. TaxID=2048138 RepID=UPI003D909C36
MKKVFIISSSPRKGGNSEALSAAFAKGASDAGHEVETVYLREKKYGFCTGCLACSTRGRCVLNDDAVEIAAKMHDADVLVFATPIYYYSVSGQLKTLLDRANPLFGSDYSFTRVYLLAAAAEDAPYVVEGAVKAVQGWVDCFDRCELADTIFAGGVNEIGDIAGHPAIEQAYRAGRAIAP